MLLDLSEKGCLQVKGWWSKPPRNTHAKTWILSGRRSLLQRPSQLGCRKKSEPDAGWISDCLAAKHPNVILLSGSQYLPHVQPRCLECHLAMRRHLGAWSLKVAPGGAVNCTKKPGPSGYKQLHACAVLANCLRTACWPAFSSGNKPNDPALGGLGPVVLPRSFRFRPVIWPIQFGIMLSLLSRLEVVEHEREMYIHTRKQ